MPERSFGRTIRYRRTKLGMSQAKLAELVGRSATTIRSWERDMSVPNEGAVIAALAAVLDVDRRSLFEKAGLEMPPEETSPTVEQALASLSAEARPAAMAAASSVDPGDRGAEHTSVDVDDYPVFELDLDDISEDPAQGSEPEPEPATALEASNEVPAVGEPIAPADTLSKAPLTSSMASTNPAPAFVEPPEPFVLSAATPPMVEPSYMEDSSQRQLYRVRNLATVVLLVALVIILLWAFSSTIDALGSWWDDFFSTLRL
jgi:transcriptional regulator with XRE-family HTH domain